MWSVEEINDIRDLSVLRDDWHALLRDTPRATFFRTLEWLEVYWKHFGGTQKLRTLAVYEDSQLAGIVPLVVRPVRTKVGLLQYLTYPLDDWCSFYGPITDRPQAVLEAALRHVKQTARDWDVLELRWVDADVTDSGATAAALDTVGLVNHRQPWLVSSVIELHDDFETFCQRRSKNWRRNRRRQAEQLAEKGTVGYANYRPRAAQHGGQDPRWDLYDACEDVARRSWQGNSTTGTTLTHPSIRDYMRDVHEMACELGAVDLNLLSLNDTPVAFNYGYHLQGYIDVLRCGYDASMASEGAGAVLLSRCIEQWCGNGDHVADLGAGFQEYKRRWQSAAVTSYRYTHFSRTALRAQLLNFNRWRKHVLGHSAGPAEQPESVAPNTSAPAREEVPK